MVGVWVSEAARFTRHVQAAWDMRVPNVSQCERQEMRREGERLRRIVEDHADLVDALRLRAFCGAFGVGEDVDAGCERVDEKLQPSGAEGGVVLMSAVLN